MTLKNARDINQTGLDAIDPKTHPARDASHFRRIVAARKHLEAAERELRDAVAAARGAGDSWTVIGTAMDTTRQGAYQRFGRYGNRGEANRVPKRGIETYYEGDQWKNKTEGESRANGVFETKAEAQAAGRAMAKKRGVEHIIRNMDGEIGQRNSYGNDPRNTKG